MTALRRHGASAARNPNSINDGLLRRLAPLAMTRRPPQPSTCLALARRRPIRFFGRAMRCSLRRGVSPPLCRPSAFQALLKRIHQADDVGRPFLGFGGLDRLAGGPAPYPRLPRILVFR